MTTTTKNMYRSKGFIQLVIIVILIIVILSLLGISLRTVFLNTTLQENFGFMGEWLKNLWNNYLAIPFRFLYEFVYHSMVRPFWERFVAAIRDINFDIPSIR